MHLFIAFDGSDDGYDALRILLGEFDRGQPRRVTAAVIAWPIRESPLWEKALAHQIEVDDLHRSMAEVASHEAARLAALFAKNVEVKTVVADGDPVEAILDLTQRDPPDIVLVGITGGRHRHAVVSILNEVMLRMSRVVVVANGKSRTVPAVRPVS